MIRNKITWLFIIIILIIVTAKKPELGWEMADNIFKNAKEVIKLTASIITGIYY
jgi:hypothetical protein